MSHKIMRHIFVPMILLTILVSRDSGSNLCCGLEIRRDLTSDVSIVRNEGIVVFQNVSAILESKKLYVVEVRSFDSNAASLRYEDCTYAFIDKKSGKTYNTDNPMITEAIKDRIGEDLQFILINKNSCIFS